MKLKLNLLILSSICLLFAACRTAPIDNFMNISVPADKDGKQPALIVVQDTIIEACKKRGWSPTITKPGQIRATLNVRYHTAVVDINFNEEEYSIIYVSSENLDYHDGQINKNYNKWVLKLSQSIQRELGVRVQMF